MKVSIVFLGLLLVITTADAKYRPHSEKGGRSDNSGGGRHKFGSDSSGGGRHKFGSGSDSSGGGRHKFGSGSDSPGGGRHTFGSGSDSSGGGRHKFGKFGSHKFGHRGSTSGKFTSGSSGTGGGFKVLDKFLGIHGRTGSRSSGSRTKFGFGSTSSSRTGFGSRFTDTSRSTSSRSRPPFKPPTRPTFRPPTRPTPRPPTRPTPRSPTRPTPRPTTRPTPRPTTRPTPKPTTRPTPRPTTRPTPRPTTRPPTQRPPCPLKVKGCFTCSHESGEIACRANAVFKRCKAKQNICLYTEENGLWSSQCADNKQKGRAIDSGTFVDFDLKKCPPQGTTRTQRPPTIPTRPPTTPPSECPSGSRRGCFTCSWLPTRKACKKRGKWRECANDDQTFCILEYGNDDWNARCATAAEKEESSNKGHLKDWDTTSCPKSH